MLFKKHTSAPWTITLLSIVINLCWKKNRTTLTSLLIATMFGPYLPQVVWRRADVLCYLCLFPHSGVQHVLTMWITCRMSCEMQKLKILWEHMSSHPLLVGSGFFVFVFCVVYFTLSVFVLCLVYTMLAVSLDCPFVIALSDFSNA
jgi:hypothetical protein